MYRSHTMGHGSCHVECRYVFSKLASRMHHYMPLECTIASYNRAALKPIRHTLFSELPFNGFLISIFQSFTERCIQETLNEYCRNLGLLDDQTVPFEHSSQESIIIIYQNRLARTFAIYGYLIKALRITILLVGVLMKTNGFVIMIFSPVMALLLDPQLVLIIRAMLVVQIVINYVKHPMRAPLNLLQL